MGMAYQILSITLISILSINAMAAELIISKSERRLEYKSGKLTRSFPIALGTAPIGRKIRKGDRKTPEGEYFITHKNAKSQFYLSLGLSYPNIEDAVAGVDNGIISSTEYSAVKKAIQQGKLPPQHTKLGGDIFIHGGGTQSDWTWGCIALDDVDMKFLFEHIAVNDKVIIRK